MPRPTNIGIVGDSWGEPQWCDPIPGYSALGHTSMRLHQLGYRVRNSSRRGGSNVESWRALEGFGGMRDLDLIIWFHTEVL